ncbi:Cleft lip and palate transmembrane protein 1 -like protein [Halotydeus destructor]|nr:Cleft lip and palate transmembrane protein 1 -like protein [Halotydeus destructor]
MPSGEVVAPGAAAPENVATGAEQPAPAPNSFWSMAKGLAFRFLIMYLITSFFRSKPSPTTTTTDAPGKSVGAKPSSNLFINGTEMDLYVYVSENEFKPNFKDPSELVWVQKGLVYGDWYSGANGDGIFEYQTTVHPSERVLNNGSIYLHAYIVRNDYTPYPSENYDAVFTVHKRKMLNRFKKRRYKKTHNLLSGETSASKETQEKVEQNIKHEIISHWHENLTINIIDDHTPWVPGSVPQPLDEFVEFEPVTGKYYPIVYMNDYWNLLRDYQPINSTTLSLPLHLTYQPLTMFRWQMYTAQQMRSKWTSSVFGSEMMEESDEDQDAVKEAFLETSPYLLGLTVIISITHSVFEFLAFKNDIQFWKNQRSLEGLSVRSVFFNVFQSLIVLLYVLDNDTNTLIRFSVGIGLLIEIWKIQKVTNFKVDWERKIFGLIPRFSIEDKSSYTASSTKIYDELAFKYLSWGLFPLLIGYAIYSLIYLEHKSYYSWILGMLYGFLLTFGFIMMTPQLFINYKMKSVAHLPWRMLTYKFLNTFIDDIFAFVIKMPTMYRLGCFRDDIIFLIYVYQRWIYRVDYKRLNEFGVTGEQLAGTEPAPDQQAAIEESPGDKKND